VKARASIVTCWAIFATAAASGLSAVARQSAYQLPSNAQVVGYLLQSVTWYRHVYAERQVANNQDDLMFLDDNQVIEAQIVRLSFEFAKTDTTLAKIAPQDDMPSTTAPADPPHSDLTHFIEVKNRYDQVSQQAIQDVKTLNQKMGAARNADRTKLKAALDDAQRRLELLQAVSHTVSDLIEFVQSTETGQTQVGHLDLTIDDLAQSVPEINVPAAPLAKLPLQDAGSRTTDGGRYTGLLGLGSEVWAMNRKLRVVDEQMRLTEDLALSADNLQVPMAGSATRLIQSVAVSDLQTSDLSMLRQQKSQLDALTTELKGLSPAIVALDKQKVLIAEYKSHLLPWRTAVAGQYRQAWKNLLIRVLIVLLIIGLLIGTAEVSRRLTLRHVQEPTRRQVIGVVYRFVMLFAIGVVALLAVASDVRSLATYFGLLTAGVAVALQNVILASLGYLLLNGKRGIRIGDRVQVSGVTGEVINMGLLQFQLREFDVQKQRSTGHVATFSNSLVFVSPAIGLLKFNAVPETSTQTETNKTGAGPDLEESEPGSKFAGSLTAGGQRFAEAIVVERTADIRADRQPTAASLLATSGRTAT
jgi:hypothetical protein